MATAVFSVGASVTFAEGATFKYETTGQYLRKHSIGARDYERMYVSTLGVDGQGCKLGGYRGRIITLQVCFVDTNESTVAAAYDTAVNAIGSQTSGSTLALAGQTYYGVYLVAGGTTLGETTGNGLPTARAWAWATITVDAKRLA